MKTARSNAGQVPSSGREERPLRPWRLVLIFGFEMEGARGVEDGVREANNGEKSARDDDEGVKDGEGTKCA